MPSQQPFPDWTESPIILGSRSPQRRQLLATIIDPKRLRVVPPSSPIEEEFSDCRSLNAIEQRLLQIAESKNLDVCRQLGSPYAIVLTADTTIVGRCEENQWVALGQPSLADWKETVHDWFIRYYLGQTHLALTAVHIHRADGEACQRLVTTEVDMLPASEGLPLLNWYLSTNEPIGKAGGYGLQGAADLFVTAIRGSISNVIGLPLCATREMLNILKII